MPALALDPQNVDLLWEQFCAYSELKKYSKALTSLETIRKQLEDPVTGSTVLSQVLPESHAQRVIEVTKEMAQVSLNKKLNTGAVIGKSLHLHH